MIFSDFLWCYMMFYDVLWCSMIFYDALWCSMMIYVFRSFLVSFCRSVPPEFLRSFLALPWCAITSSGPRQRSSLDPTPVSQSVLDITTPLFLRNFTPISSLHNLHPFLVYDIQQCSVQQSKPDLHVKDLSNYVVCMYTCFTLNFVS